MEVKGCRGATAFPQFSHQCKGGVTAPLQSHALGFMSQLLWGFLLPFKGRICCLSL